MDWNKLYGETKPKRISLPTYPFARERYWVPEKENRTTVDVPKTSILSSENSTEAADYADYFEEWEFSLSTDSGKLDSGRTSMSTNEKAELLLRQLIANQLQKPVNQIGTHVGYIEMGISSLGLVKVVQGIERTINERISPTLLFDYFTIYDLSSYLSNRYASHFERLIVKEKEPEEKSQKK